jgi:hypothetical protein
MAMPRQYILMISRNGDAKSRCGSLVRTQGNDPLNPAFQITYPTLDIRLLNPSLHRAADIFPKTDVL